MTLQRGGPQPSPHYARASLPGQPGATCRSFPAASGVSNNTNNVLHLINGGAEADLAAMSPSSDYGLQHARGDLAEDTTYRGNNQEIVVSNSSHFLSSTSFVAEQQQHEAEADLEEWMMETADGTGGEDFFPLIELPAVKKVGGGGCVSLSTFQV